MAYCQISDNGFPIGTNDDDGDEVEGSFIILPVNSPQSNNVSSLTSELNLNVFQLGQLQLSADHDTITVSLDSGLKDGSSDDFKSATTLTSGSLTPVLIKGSDGESGHGDGHLELTSVISHMSTSSSDSNVSFEEANTRVTQLLEENNGLKAFVREQNQNQKKFLETCKNLERDVAQTKLEAREHEMKYERSRSVIETLREKLADLESKTSLAEVTRLQRLLTEKESQLEDEKLQTLELKELIRKMEGELNTAKVDATNISDISSLQVEHDRLSEAVEESKQIIAKFVQIHKDDQLKLDIFQGTVESLKTSLAETQAKLETQSEINTELQAASELKAAQIISLSEAALDVARDHTAELDAASSEVRALKDKLDQLEKSTEEKILVLEGEVAEKNIFQAQMQQYKSDFEAEREDKIGQREAKVKLADELTQLQMALETKEVQLEQLHLTHLQLANQHLNRPPGPLDAMTQSIRSVAKNLFGFRHHHGDNGADPGPSSNRPAGDGDDSVGDVTSQGAAANPVEVEEEDPPNKCPLCKQLFPSQRAVIVHCYSCGDDTPRPSSPSPLEFP